MNLVIVGATGLVGRTMIEVILERGVRYSTLTLAASERSAGKTMATPAGEYTICTLEKALESEPGIALFSAGSQVSKDWAPRFAGKGFRVIDNSSAWRKDPDIPLVVPEVNGRILTSGDRIIANPNCSTIQMVLALAPLHGRYGIRRVVVSTYQSVTGSGMRGVNQLLDEEAGRVAQLFYPHPIHHNLIPQGGDFNEDGYTTEEEKLISETRKILGDQEIQVSPTVVRVPVTGGHSESINITLKQPVLISEIRKMLAETPGIIVEDDPSRSVYPMPRKAEGRDEVFVGRLRLDPSDPSSINMWVVSDNLRKGAATNAVQIAEYLIRQKLV